MRITKVYTKTGDDGTTELSKGERMPKDSPRIVILGALDEVNAAIGVVLAENLNKIIEKELEGVQHDLFNIGGELAVLEEDLGLVKSDNIKKLEEAIDSLNESLPPLEEFVLPGGSRRSALLYQAKVICRRTERDLVTLSHKEKINPLHLKYLNRLSDYLFVAARYENMKGGGEEQMWKRKQ